MTATTHDDDSLRRDLLRAAATQRGLCERGGSPTYVALIDALAVQVSARRGSGWRLLAADPGTGPSATRTALYLRLLGAAVRIAGRHDHDLVGCYPTYGGRSDPGAAVAAFADVLDTYPDEVRAEMAHHMQTNEPRRSAPLAAAFAHVSALTGLPLRLREVGASAGLNLSLDRYRIDLPAAQPTEGAAYAGAPASGWGPESSPVRIRGAFTQGLPPSSSFTVADRAGCDRAPHDLRHARSRELLESFIWPEHVERLRLFRAAAGVAEHGLVERSDALPWTRRELAGTRPGVVTVVFHTVVATYFDTPTREGFDDVMTDALARATTDAPVAWVAMEPDGDRPAMNLTVAVAPYHPPRVLATCTAHAHDIRWRDGDH